MRRLCRVNLGCKLIKTYQPICNDGTTTVAAVADIYPLEFALTSTRNAYDVTNVIVCANNASEKRKGSKHGSLRNAAPNAEPGTLIQYLIRLIEASREASQPTQERDPPPG